MRNVCVRANICAAPVWAYPHSVNTATETGAWANYAFLDGEREVCFCPLKNVTRAHCWICKLLLWQSAWHLRGWKSASSSEIDRRRSSGGGGTWGPEPWSAQPKPLLGHQHHVLPTVLHKPSRNKGFIYQEWWLLSGSPDAGTPH